MSARITISLPNDLARIVGREAKRRGESVSALVRKAVEAYLTSDESTRRELPFVGIGHSGKKHTARNAEQILEREWGRARRR